MKTLLKEYLRNLLIEGPKSESDALNDDLALMYDQEGEMSWYVLYKPSYFFDAFNNEVAEFGKISEIPFDIFHDPKGIVAVLLLRVPEYPCMDALEIKKSAAEKGWGPLIYDIAMSDAPTQTLVPDRDSVSDAAYGVWDKYMKLRGDVQKYELDDINNPRNDDPRDDCKLHNDKKRPGLDYAYSGNVSNGAQLKKRHQEFIKDISLKARRAGAKNVNSQDIDAALMLGGEYFFDIKYYAGIT